MTEAARTGTHERETEFRRRKFAQIVAAAPADHARPTPPFVGEATPRRSEILEVLDQFRASRDVESFRATVHSYSSVPVFNGAVSGFNFGVAMFLNSLVKKVDDNAELGALLINTIEVPANEQHADAKLAALMEQVELVKEGGAPAPKSAAIFCSFFWWLQAPQTWPFLRPAVEDAVEALGWLPKGLDPVERYRQYRSLIRSLRSAGASDGLVPDDMTPSSLDATSIAEVDEALTWFNDHQWIGLDDALGERLRWAAEVNEHRVDNVYQDDWLEVAQTNMAAVLAELRILGDVCETPVSEALGRNLRRHISNEAWWSDPIYVRENAFVKWRPKGGDGWNDVCSLMASVTLEGIGIGVTSGRRHKGWQREVRDELTQLLPPGLKLIHALSDPFRDVEKPTGNDYMLGTLIPAEEAFGNPEVADEIERVAAALQPVMDRVMALAGNAEQAAMEADDVAQNLQGDGSIEEDAEPADEGAELEERLDALVDDCHLDGRSFVDDLVDLLRDKRQIVLYGPPGTGKTYIARKLAEALAPSADRRR